MKVRRRDGERLERNEEAADFRAGATGMDASADRRGDAGTNWGHEHGVLDGWLLLKRRLIVNRRGPNGDRRGRLTPTYDR